MFLSAFCAFLRLYVRWCWVFKLFSEGMMNSAEPDPNPNPNPNLTLKLGSCDVSRYSVERKSQKEEGTPGCEGFKMTLRKSLHWKFVILKGWSRRKILDKRRRGSFLSKETTWAGGWELSRHTGGQCRGFPSGLYLITKSNPTIRKTKRHKFSRGAWGSIVSIVFQGRGPDRKFGIFSFRHRWEKQTEETQR